MSPRRQPPASSGIALKPTPKAYHLEQDKARPPEETVAWVSARLEEMGQGVLRKVMRIDTGRLDIPVYLSMCGEVATSFTGTMKQMGKGASPAQAEASALMELAERFSFFSFMQETEFPVITAPKVEGPAMAFQRVAQSLYHPADDLERAERVYGLLPQTWAWARDLAADREEQIPLGWFYAINEYNGPAAGNTQEEAVLQSLCEVVERHVSALVTLEERPTPAIDPASIEDPVALELLDKLAKNGIQTHLKDFTCEMGIPSVAALCWDPATFPQKSEIVYAAGTATSPAKALIRAVTEVAQLAGDFETGSSYKVSALPKFADLTEAAYVTRAEGTVSLGDLPDLSRDDIFEEVRACAQALAERGFAVYSLDVSHPRLQVPAVYTIMPGAHFASRTTGTDVLFHSAKLAASLAPARALTVLEAMAKVAGDRYYFPFFEAVALIELGLAEEALAALNQALALGPPPQDEASVHTQRGVALKDLERYAEAKEALEKAASFPEPHHEVFNLLGFCHFKLKEHAEAIEAFSQAVEIEPGAAINYANIAVNLREMGQTAQAVEMFHHALELDPSLDWAREALAKLERGS